MGNLIYGIVGVVVLVMVIPLIGTAIAASKTSGGTNYTATELTLLNLVPTLIVVGLIIGALVYAGLHMKK